MASRFFSLQIKYLDMLDTSKETALERADFALQLLMFVTVIKEKNLLTIFCLSINCQPMSP